MTQQSYCTAAWDGQDLLPLSASDRKLIFDNSSKALDATDCIAFAYRPVYRLSGRKKVCICMLNVNNSMSIQ